MLSACSGAKRGASSIQTMPDGSVIASTSFGSGRRHALAGASRTMSAAVRTLGAEAAAAGAGRLRVGGDGRDEKAGDGGAAKKAGGDGHGAPWE